jgi:hypothetical protein
MAGGGFSAFLKSAFVTISEDALELRYAGVGDSGVIGDIHDDEED